MEPVSPADRLFFFPSMDVQPFMAPGGQLRYTALPPYRLFSTISASINSLNFLNYPQIFSTHLNFSQSPQFQLSSPFHRSPQSQHPSSFSESPLSLNSLSFLNSLNFPQLLSAFHNSLSFYQLASALINSSQLLTIRLSFCQLPSAFINSPQLLPTPLRF
jgi:hypothetical protein